jgi:hypothetical protein
MLAARCVINNLRLLTRPPLHSRLDRPQWAAANRRLARIAGKLMKDRPMELILTIVLLLVLFGGGFGFYRGGYYRQGGPVGIGGVLGLILVILAIGWLVHGTSEASLSEL